MYTFQTHDKCCSCMYLASEPTSFEGNPDQSNNATNHRKPKFMKLLHNMMLLPLFP